MKKGLILVAVVAGLALIWWAVTRFFSLADIQALAARATEFTQSHLGWVILALVLAHAIGMMFALPSKAVFTLLSGALLGPVLGTIVTSTGVFFGTTVLFFTTRHFFREAVSQRLGDLGKRIEARLTGHPIRALVGLRLFITIPYAPITLAAALSRMSYRQFITGTLLGDTPVVIAYVMAAHRLFMLTSLREALSPWTAGMLLAVGLFIFLTAVIGKRQEKVISDQTL